MRKGREMDLFGLIKQDHDRYKQMLSQMQNEQQKSQQQTQMFEQFGQDISAHMAVEEEGLYEALKKQSQSKEHALEAYEEHHAAKMVFQELQEMPQTSERWMAKLKVFKEMVEHHIQEEESQVFEDARQYLKDTQLEEMADKWESEKQSMMKKTGTGKTVARGTSGGKK